MEVPFHHFSTVQQNKTIIICYQKKDNVNQLREEGRTIIQSIQKLHHYFYIYVLMYS